MNHKVSTEECALAIALPLDEFGFREGIRRGKDFDFARSILKRNLGLSEDGAWSLYSPTAYTLGRIGREVEAMGVRVCYGTSLSDLALLLRDYPVVTLAAHCRLMPFQEEDILDPIGFERVVGETTLPKDQLMEALSGSLRVARQNSLETGDARQRIVIGLNMMVNPAHAWYERDMAEPSPDGDAVGAIFNRLTRAELEYRFPEFLAPGRCVELENGLCTIPELVAATPEEFAGIFDLSLCNSAVLERSIKAVRPKCLLVINQGLAAIDARIIRYKLIALRLAQSPTSFIEALREVHLALKRGSQ